MSDPIQGTLGLGWRRRRSEPVLLQVRPLRITIYASICATAVIITAVVVGILLHGTNDGVQFRLADQIGLIGVGVLLGAAVLTGARPRARVFASGIAVRNVWGERFFEWPLVLRIAYPQNAPWAQIVLPDDELHPLMAIQRIDRMRAVNDLKRLRALRDEYGPASPVGEVDFLPSPDPTRPLGRLEIIDQQKAAGIKGKRHRI